MRKTDFDPTDYEPNDLDDLQELLHIAVVATTRASLSTTGETDRLTDANRDLRDVYGRLSRARHNLTDEELLEGVSDNE